MFRLGNKHDKFKQKSKKVLWHKEMYPTDFRKSVVPAQQLLINFFTKNGCTLKAKNLIKSVVYTLYNLLIFKVPPFLTKTYKFFETFGHIIAHDNT
jgi:hypothetical protein